MRTPLLVLGSFLLVFVHCRPSPRQSLAAFYRSIEEQFVAGHLAEADDASGRIESLLRQSKEQSTVWAARFRLQRAKIWFYQGHSAQALALLTPPIGPGVAEPEIVAARSNLLALAYGRTGDYAHAEQALDEAQHLCHDDLSRADFHLAEGVVHGEKGDLEKAKRAFRLSLISSRGANDSFFQAQALSNLGVVALQQEHYDEALDQFAMASAAASKVGAGIVLEKATGGAAWAFYKLGDYPRALTNFKTAEEQAAQLGAPLDQVEWLNNAGLSEFHLGDLRAASHYYEQSYRLAESLHSVEEISHALLALAYLSLETGDLAGAIDKSRQVRSLAAEKRNQQDQLEPTFIEALALSRQGQTREAQSRFFALQQNLSIQPSLLWQTQNALAGLAANQGKGRAAERWFRRAVATFQAQRSSLQSVESRLPFFENGNSLYLGYMEELIGEGKIDAALAVLDQSRAETLAEGLGLSSTQRMPPPQNAASSRDAQGLAHRLNGTILVYCLRPQTSYLWAISPRRSAFFKLPGSAQILPLAAAHAQAILSSKDLLAQPGAPGLLLYQDLVKPASALIAPKSRIFVIADEALNGLNFETLLVPGTSEPHYWLEDADIVNARSISLLAASHPPQSREPHAKRLLLVGDPIYSRPGEEQLPHASDEMNRIAAHFIPERRVVLTGVAATPAAYQRSQPEAFAYIHFVAHASANEISPLDSSVLLSAPPAEAAAYRLYARMILEQRLSADLVTLSACYGSGVRSYAGEGLVGLAWAFLHSGSHRVIGALWSVSDASTPQLMSDLYNGLAKGEQADTALRSAKLEMLHSSGVFRKPFYWAAFQLYAGA